MGISSDDIRRQSENAYEQWCVQWREQAKINSKFNMKPLSDFANTGIGRAIVCVANGYSFEKNIEVLKKYQDNVDIMACDKTMGHLLDNGITPTFVLVCDANVNYEKYMEPWKDKLQDTIVFCNVCANPKWVENGNWKDMYFFVNQDILKSEKEFSSISGCYNFIPAGTNVSNAMVVFLCQSGDKGRLNFFGYDKILLTGYDYAWQWNTKYYSFSERADGKNNYMRHVYVFLNNGEYGYSSNNLLFSAKWLDKYIRTFGLPVIQTTKHTILSTSQQGDLEDQMRYRFKPEHSKEIIDIMKERDKVMAELKKIDNRVVHISKEHHQSYLMTT